MSTLLGALLTSCVQPTHDEVAVSAEKSDHDGTAEIKTKVFDKPLTKTYYRDSFTHPATLEITVTRFGDSVTEQIGLGQSTQTAGVDFLTREKVGDSVVGPITVTDVVVDDDQPTYFRYDCSKPAYDNPKCWHTAVLFHDDANNYYIQRVATRSMFSTYHRTDNNDFGEKKSVLQSDETLKFSGDVRFKVETPKDIRSFIYSEACYTLVSKESGDVVVDNLCLPADTLPPLADY